MKVAGYQRCSLDTLSIVAGGDSGQKSEEDKIGVLIVIRLQMICR